MPQITIDRNLCFLTEKEAYPGVVRVAELVKKDISLVVGSIPSDYLENSTYANMIIYGTVGHSHALCELENRCLIDVSGIRDSREVYSFTVIDQPWEGIDHALVIAGSDKRGTIYGLFHLSELLGISPLVNWNHVYPEKRESIVLSDIVNKVSKVPSVKYRGFFINDEWPAFGTWAYSHFGGINAKCYERIFELLLRLKGNYLWPAMWRSNFSMDGPGLESAMLADELGVVMSTSHHEPCMRSGEEYGLLRGKASCYGDAWDFTGNPRGITRFWKDGLIRNSKFENVYTLGMRGERDTALLGKEASLEDNIRLLRNVLKTQNELLRETINSDIEQIPRQIVLFTEVEEFFYGNEQSKGLKDDPELEGVTLILSDNNHGYLRTLPTHEMRNHKGGYGMYYHMDMHGGAHSFQWIGSTYLPRVWEQMTAAYEYGVREIWVTNIGDIGTQEYGLSFFLDLAYDIEKWGGKDASVTKKYTGKWLNQNFGNAFSSVKLQEMEKVMWDYTGLLAKRKHEVMNEDVYHPVHFGEAQNILDTAEEILRICRSLKAECKPQTLSAFISLFFYPACGTANLMKLWILAGRNKLYAGQNKVEANLLANEVRDCVNADEAFVEEYQSIDDGYYHGFGLSEHIGFTNWNDEDNKYPVCHYIFPANQPRMLISRINDEEYMTGLYWTNKPQVWSDALRQDVDEINFELSCGSRRPFSYRIVTECPWLSFSKTEGVVEVKERICIKVNKEQITGRVKGVFHIYNIGYGEASVEVEAENQKEIPKRVFIEADGYISMYGCHYQRKQDTSEGGFEILNPYGREGSAIKVFPPTADFFSKEEKPYVEYDFQASDGGQYVFWLYLSPSTPVTFDGHQYLGYSINDNPMETLNTVEHPETPFFLSRQWEREAIANSKLVKAHIDCRKGLNRLRFWGISPAVILEKIVICRVDIVLPESYLGPGESYIREE